MKDHELALMAGAIEYIKHDWKAAMWAYLWASVALLVVGLIKTWNDPTDPCIPEK